METHTHTLQISGSNKNNSKVFMAVWLALSLGAIYLASTFDSSAVVGSSALRGSVIQDRMSSEASVKATDKVNSEATGEASSKASSREEEKEEKPTVTPPHYRISPLARKRSFLA